MMNNPYIIRSQNTQNKFIVIPFLSAVAVVILWIIIIVTFPGLDKFPIMHDIPLMHYLADRILIGEVPYRDFFDMNLPGVYLIHMFVLTVFGKSDLAWAKFSFFWLGLTSLACGLYCWRISRLAALLAPALTIILVLMMGIFSFGQRDFLIVLPLLLALHFIANVLETQSWSYISNWQLFFAGSLLGTASCIKPFPIVLTGVLVGIISIVSRNNWKILATAKRNQFRRLIQTLQYLQPVIFLISGAMIVPVILMIWLYLNGGLASFLSIQLEYNMTVYNRLHRHGVIDLMVTAYNQMRWFWISLPMLIMGVLLSRRIKEICAIRVWLITLSVAYGVFHWVIQGKGWLYHCIPLFIFSLLLSALMCGQLLRDRLLVQVVGFTWLLSMISLYGIVLYRIPYAPDPISFYKPAVAQLVHDLQFLRGDENQSVQVMDVTEGGIHALYLLGYRQATRYIYDFQFLKAVEDPVVQKLRYDFLEQLDKQPPQLIVIFDHGWEQDGFGLARYGSFPQFLKFLKINYFQKEKRPYYTIYQHR